MADFYPHLLALHILFAVVFIGPISLIAILAIREPTGGALRTSMKTAQWLIHPGLGLMLLTGILLLWITGWGYLRSGWFIVSIVLMMIIGNFAGNITRALKKAEKAEDPASQAQSLRIFGWVLLISTIGVVWLMATKPF